MGGDREQSSGLGAWLRSAPASIRLALLAVVAVAAGVGVGAAAAAVLGGDADPGVTVAKRGKPRFAPPVGGTAPQPSANQDVDPQAAPGSTPPEVRDYKPGKGFRADNAGVRRLFNRTLGGRGRGGLNQNHLVGVSCKDGDCLIRYIPDGPGAGRVIEAQGPLWKGLLADRRWRSATVVALRGGPDIYAFNSQREAADSNRPAKAGAPVVRLSCTRDAVRRIGDWGSQTAARIPDICKLEAVNLSGR